MENQQKKTPRTDAMRSVDMGDLGTIDLIDLFFRLLKGWKLIVALALIFAIGAAYNVQYRMKPQYRATSTIYVVARKDSAINMSDLQLGSALTQDYIKVFKMWEVHDEVIRNLDLPYSYGGISSMLRVTNDTDTRMLDISVSSTNPAEAAAIANEYAKVASKFIEETMVTTRPTIMSVALVPSNPYSPNKTSYVMKGFLIGAFLAAGYIVLRALLDDKYKTADDIRRYTGLPTLAVIPLNDSGKNDSGRNSDKRKKGKGGK